MDCDRLRRQLSYRSNKGGACSRNSHFSGCCFLLVQRKGQSFFQKGVSEPDAAQQIKDSCRASFLAAAKSWVELNTENNFRVWSFKAGEKGSGAERSEVVCAWAASKQRSGRVKRGNGSFSRPSFSGNQRGGHTAAMAHSEVSADSAGVAGGRTSW